MKFPVVPIRQTAALVCASTIAWDYLRTPDIMGVFSIWVLCSHFIYFQLPLKSRALPFFHSCSFIGAAVSPWVYGYLLLWDPSIEINRMNTSDMTFEVIIIRSVCINVAPLIFHALDITVNLKVLQHSYMKMPKRLMYVFSFISFGILGFVYEVMCPESEEYEGLDALHKRTFIWRSKMLSLTVSVIAFFILYTLILKPAYRRTQ